MKDLIIFDLDETLLDLNLDVKELRLSIHNIFKEHGCEPNLEPLYQGIAQATAKIRETNPTLAQNLENQIWESITNYEQTCAKTRAIVRPGALDLLNSLQPQNVAVYSNNHQTAVKQALEAAGFTCAQFESIVGRTSNQSLKPSAEPILDCISRIGLDRIDRIFFVGDSHYDALCVKNAQAILKDQKKIHFVALHPDSEKLDYLETLGASFIAREYTELKPILTTPRSDISLSLVVMAYNEEDSVEKVVSDASYFSDAYIKNLELIFVDDGSTDQTKSHLAKFSKPRLKIITHTSNLGMGASMYSGYIAASNTFAAHLPGDRQVRAQNLVPLLPQVKEGTVVYSTYAEPPSGQKRQIMSRIFRMWKTMGGLSKDFAGTYIFETQLLKNIPPYWTTCRTFVLSFVLLQAFHQHSQRFEQVTIRPFRRQFGASKEAVKKNILNVFWEVLKYKFLG